MSRRRFFIILFIVVLSFGAASLVMAAGPIKFKPAVQIPGLNIPAEGIDITPTTVGEYIKAIYTFSVYAGSILAVVVLMIGGFIWLTAGGNVSQVGQARSYIGGAISGFVLLLLSWTLLQMVNPRLVEFKPIVVNEVGNVPLDVGGCGYNTPEFVDKTNLTPNPQGYKLVPTADSDCTGLTRSVGTSCYCFKKQVGLTTCCAYYKNPNDTSLPSCKTGGGDIPQKCVDSSSAFANNTSQCPNGPVPVVTYTAQQNESCRSSYSRFQSQIGLPDCDLCGGGT